MTDETAPDTSTPEATPPAAAPAVAVTHESEFQKILAYIESLGSSAELTHAKAHLANALHWVKQHV